MLSLKKKISTYILLGVIATTSISTMTISSQENIGDLNGDGIINFNDIKLLKTDVLCGENNSISDKDINGDGIVNVLDVCNMKHDILYSSSSNIPDYGTPMDETATSIADFRKGTSSMFIASDGWGNGSCFDCGWFKENAVIEDGHLSLTIDEDETNQYSYAGAEYRTNDFYHYGYYETSMQAIKNDGVVSSFFTYTGPSDNNPWDEIDIEILGKDTTKVQFNYYTDGVGNHEYMYDLGFDASEGYHTYGFDWQPDKITWYVDGEAVYSATTDIPSTPGKIMMNVWPGTGVDAWLNAYDGTTPLTANYQWVTYKENGQSSDDNTDIKDYGTPMDETATSIADFRKGTSSMFIASDGWGNGSCFDCGWFKENAVIENGHLSLTIDEDETNQYSYAGAEYRTNDFYHYGYYETSMQAIKNDGVVSSFFTYTGPSDNNPWDEIDIEILGKDTTKVQFNYYTDGVGNHEYMYDLGFDASEGYHTYGFDWQPDKITWYVDGEAVYSATTDIPSTPGKIMMNVWPGTGVDAWLNAYDGTTPLTANYQWVTYKENGQSSDDNTDIKDYGTPMDETATSIADFRKGTSSMFIASDGWGNGSCFDCGWFKENAVIENGHLSLTIDEDETNQYSYAGAEYRTNDFYHYGYYETSMQAIKNDGVVSSFFTYTGPSDNNPWDEIDIEILGKDTTKVQFNYYTDGVGNHEYMYDLGFDASEGHHTYGFDWQPDKITWYVDGEAVYSATTDIPSTPGKIMMNVWPGTGVDAWLNAYDGTTPLTANYQWVTYKENGQSSDDNTDIKDYGTPMDETATSIADFRKGTSSMFIASDGWGNGSCFDCGWFKENAVIENGHLSLTIDEDETNQYSYAGAEYRTNDFYHYGYYETSMQAIKNDGVVSSFFTYTGPSDNNPWDEIDIEILGKDTTKVQFNYYTDGVGNHEYMYDLGFDASEGYHTYGFDWQPDKITWYVDGEAVYSATTDIPSTPGKIMMNVWPGTGVDAWLNAYDGTTPLTANYQWVTYKE